MNKFMINVPKDWDDTKKEELQQKLIKAKIFGEDDSVFITNKYTIHEVSTETYDMLAQMKDKIDGQ